MAVVACLLTFAYGQLSRAFPFYYLWDMDWTTALDALLIQQGLLPDHINHTGFGMYLVLAWSHSIGHALGLVSLLDLSDVRAAGNPLLGAAELTDYFRAHTPFVLLACVLTQLAAVRGVARLARGGGGAGAAGAPWFTALALLVLGVQDALFYQATEVRSEAYSVLFWCAGAWAGVAALRARSRRTSALRFALCGALLALSWTTKLQSLILIGWLLVGFGLLRELGWSRSPLVRLEPVTGRWLHAPGLSLFAAVAALAAAAKHHVVPQGLATFVEGYQANSAALLLFAAYAAPLLLALRRRRLAALDALLVGGLSALALHLLVYPSLSAGWSYLLVDLKMLLFRTNYQDLDRFDLLSMLQRLTAELRGAPSTYVVHAGVVVLALHAARRPRARALLVLAEAVLLLHVMVATRDIPRDAIWSHLPVTLWTLALATALLARRRAPAWGVAGLVVLLLLSQVGSTSRLRPKLHTVYVDYGWRVERWLVGVYDGEQRRYAALLAPKIDPAARDRWVAAAAAHARDWAQVKRDLGHVMVNEAVDLRDVTTAAEGFVLPHDDGSRLVAVPPRLRGGVVVRPTAWAPTPHDLDLSAVRRAAAPVGERQGASSTRPPLALLGRPDLEVRLFLPAGAPAPHAWAEAPEVIELDTAAGRARLQGFLPRERYAEVATDRLVDGAFVLVKRRF